MLKIQILLIQVQVLGLGYLDQRLDCKFCAVRSWSALSKNVAISSIAKDWVHLFW